MPIRIVQIQRGTDRRIAVVERSRLQLCDMPSIHSLVTAADEGGVSLWELLDAAKKGIYVDYEAVYNGKSEWQLLAPVDHPDPAHCFVTGTGLTHLGSAQNRNAMHGKKDDELTDSMKMFKWGMEGGKPKPGHIGIAPEWFYKGTGTILRGHGDFVDSPGFAEDGGEEAEIAGVYIIDLQGRPIRVGMTQGNEFSDHVFERKNYLNLAGSKLRQCSIGPELVIDPEFDSVKGRAAILRADVSVWTKEIATGEEEMCHSLANIEHHHFKFENHRRPGDVHVHFFGACALSFGDGIKLQDGDVMEVSFDGFGRPLRNTLRVGPEANNLVKIRRI